jgi:hypothetical protein
VTPVRAGRSAVIAGMLGAAFTLAVFAVRDVPDAVVAVLGGPTGVERYGGARIRFRPPADAAEGAIALGASHAKATRDGDFYVIELPGVSREQLVWIEDALVGGGLQLFEATSGSHAMAIALSDPTITTDVDGADLSTDGVELVTDRWYSATEGRMVTSAHLRARTREALEAVLAGARGRDWRPEVGSEILFESKRDPSGAEYHRTFEVIAEPVLDGRAIADAIAGRSSSGAPSVLVELEPDHATWFCELTRRGIGRKLAIVVGGSVRSAPLIQNAICTGQVEISVGSGDAISQLREQRALLAVLQVGAVPRGGTIEGSRWIPPADVVRLVWIARGVLAVLAALVLAMLAAVVVWIARPYARPELRGAGAWPLGRIAITALSPLPVLALSRIPVPLVDVDDTFFAPIARPHLDELGLVAVIVALVVTDVLVALVRPLASRIGAVTVIAIVLAVGVQGYGVARGLLGSLAIEPGVLSAAIVTAALAGGALLQVATAVLITRHGVGNGLGVVIVAAWLVHAIADAPPLAIAVLGAVAALGVAAVLGLVSAWRIGEVGLRVPTSGILPLALVPVAALGSDLLVFLGSGDDLAAWLQRIPSRAWLVVALLSIPIWAVAFTRPNRLERLVGRAGVAVAWGRALVATAVVIATVAIVSHVTLATGQAAAYLLPTPLGGYGGIQHVFAPLTAAIAGAVILDAVADARAYRATPLTRVCAIRCVQHAGVIERALEAAAIPYHLRASRLRTLLGSFGSFAPVEVIVATEHEAAAREVIGGVRSE